MITCESVQRFLPIWVDGESIPIDEASMRAHVDGCEACRREELRQREFRGALKAAFVVERAPASLSRRIAFRRHRAKLGFVAAAAAVLVGLAVLWPAGDGEADVVAVHESLVSERLPLELGAAEALAGVRAKLGLDVQLPALAQSKLRLRGARLAQLQGRDAGLLVFDDEASGKPVTLSVQARRGPRVNGPPVFRNRRVGAYDVVSWDHGALTYSLVASSAASARNGCAACHVTPP